VLRKKREGEDRDGTVLPVGEEIRASEEELRDSDAWKYLQQEVAGTAVSGELQNVETEEHQRRKRKGISQGLVCNFRNLQGPLGKNKFNYCSRAQT
jgi:hypothetical protein